MKKMDEIDTNEMYLLRSTPSRQEDEPAYKVIVVPGNPGLAGYYKEFVTVLYLSLVSGGFSDVTVAALSHKGHWKKTESAWYSLEDQVEHTVEQLLRLTSPSDRVVLVGHSIGCYICLHALDDRRLRSRRLDQALLLFPTMERMALTPNGLRAFPLTGRLFQYLALLLMLLFGLLPARVRRGLVAEYLRRCHGADLHRCAVDATLDLLSAGALPQVLHMANHEMAEVRELDVALFRRCLDRIVVCYGREDRWCPQEFYWEMCDRFPAQRGLRLRLFDANYPHAFVLGYSRPLAEHCRALLEAVWRPGAGPGPETESAGDGERGPDRPEGEK